MNKTSTAPLRVSMVGIGGFGSHRRMLMRKTGLFQIVTAYDLNQQALADAKTQDGAEPVDSYEELLATPEIEAVVISTGAKFHAEQVIAALERGLHVFVEKPLCATPSETTALVEAQKCTGLVVGMGHNDCNANPYLQRMKTMIEAGELGEIVCFEKTTAHSGGLCIKPGDWRDDPTKNPGGMLFQCGVHALYDLLYLFGPIATVSSLMRYDAHSSQTADAAHCMLQTVSGITGSLNAYHVTPYRHTFSIFGTKGALHKRDRFFDEGTSLVFQPLRVNGKEKEIPINIDPSSDDGTSGLRSFYNAVRTGSPCYPSLIDGARAVAVVFAAEEAAKTGKQIKLSEELS